MFKKILDKIVMGTYCYLALQEKFMQVCEDFEFANEVIKKYNTLTNKNKTKARQIIRAINKDDKVLAKKLCNQIIKGE